MKIGLIGAGRLGICLALLIEQAGYDVIASDVREAYVNELQDKKYSGSEPVVGTLLNYSKNIEFTTDNDRVILESDVIFTLVSTPSNEDGSYDISNVEDVVSDFQRLGWKTTGSNGSGLTGKSLVIGCTTNPGDCNVFQDRLLETGVDVYYNPEFIAQGSIVTDLQNADMVLIGGNGHHVSVLEEIYQKIQDGFGGANIRFMSTKAAELTKIATNCFLTMKITYANQVGQVMIRDGMDDEVDTVLKAIGSDSRIGNKYLGFGFGFGGPCFPRDNRAFAAHSQAVGVDHAIGETTDNFNDAHTEFLRDYYLNKNKAEVPFCFKYLTYKPGIDIFVESRPHDLAVALLDEGYKVLCMDDTCKDQWDKRIEFTPAPIEPVCWIDL